MNNISFHQLYSHVLTDVQSVIVNHLTTNFTSKMLCYKLFIFTDRVPIENVLTC